ncbi:actin family protein [Babesia bovis T2Bo]|uniref:Actin family protein n=1 Tax=Babesia bovis TaxID=5865 RepID=A7AQ08_BABBO|nr:actin family protein [Babesia bovis T2Bo]EDO08642.1 actin family protein [Babesia bovis T2Bo]|eukprot:XP_001612210.1 actin family protein [Babesia bovis T2Bo]
MSDETLALVLDTGSYSTKIGYSGAEKPQCVFRTLCAYKQGEELVVGQAALNHVDSSTIISPFIHGIVRNWALAERIWKHAFDNALKVPQTSHPLLLSEPPLNPKLHREKCAQLLFEAFEVPGLFICPSSLMALYGSGKTSGLVVDVGEGVSHAVPVLEGTPLPHAVQRLDIGGSDLTSFLVSKIPELNPSLYQSRIIANDIKSACCYMASNYNQQLQSVEKSPAQFTKKYSLPDGNVISLGKEVFQCPEIILAPHLFGRYCPSLIDVVCHSARSCEPEHHKTMFTNILLTGGSTMFDGFLQRCEKELKEATHDNVSLKVMHNIPNRDIAVWTGGSIVASLSSFQQMWVTKEEYDESGPTVVHRKCF